MGVSEPYAKRTVEGDMGMRESSICILREVGDKALASGAGVTAEQIEQGVQTRITTTGYLPDTPCAFSSRGMSTSSDSPARSAERCRMAAGFGLLTITPPMPMISQPPV